MTPPILKKLVASFLDNYHAAIASGVIIDMEAIEFFPVTEQSRIEQGLGFLWFCMTTAEKAEARRLMSLTLEESTL